MTRKQFSIKTALKDSGDLALSGLDPWQDGLTYNPYPLETAGLELMFNGTNWDRKRNNQQGTLLARAVRTVSTNSNIQTNYNAKGIVVMINVNSIVTGGLTTLIRITQPSSPGNDIALIALPKITATGKYAYTIYPGASSGGNGAYSNVIPRNWYIQVNPDDSTNWDYSIDFCYIA